MEVAAAATGALISGGLGMMGQDAANEANAELARENRNVQIELANSAHQREVADLRAAGLNPILSVGGHGADVPTSAPPVMQNSLAHMGNALAKGITDWSAIKQTQKVDAEVDTLKSQEHLNEASVLQKAAETTSAYAVADKASADAAAVRARMGLIPYEQKNIDTNTRKTELGWAGSTFGTKFPSWVQDNFSKAAGGYAAAGKHMYNVGAGYANSAKDAVSEKFNDIISSITTNSAKAVKSFGGVPNPKFFPNRR